MISDGASGHKPPARHAGRPERPQSLLRARCRVGRNALYGKTVCGERPRPSARRCRSNGQRLARNGRGRSPEFQGAAEVLISSMASVTDEPPAESRRSGNFVIIARASSPGLALGGRSPRIPATREHSARATGGAGGLGGGRGRRRRLHQLHGFSYPPRSCTTHSRRTLRYPVVSSIRRHFEVHRGRKISHFNAEVETTALCLSYASDDLFSATRKTNIVALTVYRAA